MDEKTENKVKGGDAAENRANNTNDENRDVTSPPVAPAPMLPPRPINQGHGQNEQPTDGRLKRGLEVIEILAVIIGVVVLIFQSCEMRKGTEATLKSVEVSRGQLDVMQKQIDDARLQQRAWLQLGELTIKRAPRDAPDNYSLECSYTIKNVGSTPAIDLGDNKTFVRENTWRDQRNGGFTRHEKWTFDKTKNPTPIKNGDVVMPQDTITNVFKTENMFIGDNVYIEYWISFRDVYFQSYVIGGGGIYDFKKDLFTLEFRDQRQIKRPEETNSPAQK